MTSPREDWKPHFQRTRPNLSRLFRISWRRRNVVDCGSTFHYGETFRLSIYVEIFLKSAKVMKMSFNSPSVRRSRAYGGSHLSSFPQYQSLAETYGCSVVHKSYMSDSFARCSGLYHHDLLGHFGCVNAIEFSSNGGEFIVSGAHFVLLIFDFVLCFGPLIRGSPILS